MTHHTYTMALVRQDLQPTGQSAIQQTTRLETFQAANSHIAWQTAFNLAKAQLSNQAPVFAAGPSQEGVNYKVALTVGNTITVDAFTNAESYSNLCQLFEPSQAAGTSTLGKRRKYMLDVD